MSTADDALVLRTVLEEDLTWRWDEIRHIRNTWLGAEDAFVGNVFKRAYVVMLYSHFEGYTKFAIGQYAECLSRVHLSIEMAKTPLGAACLMSDFKEHSTPLEQTEDTSSKKARQILKNARLVDRILSLKNQPLKFDPDLISSADSNLSADILRRNLAILAIEDDSVKLFADQIDGLLKWRNKIAHGEAISISDSSLSAVAERIVKLCERLTVLLFTSLKDENYLRPVK